MPPRDDDKSLSALGRRSWLKESLEPKPGREPVITGYTPLPQSSVQELRGMVEKNPDDLNLRDMLAFVLYSNGRLDEAMKIYKYLIEQEHNVANQHLYLGNCYYQKGLIQLALLEWEKVLRTSIDESFRQRARSRIERAKAGVSINFKE